MRSRLYSKKKLKLTAFWLRRVTGTSLQYTASILWVSLQLFTTIKDMNILQKLSSIL